MERLGITYAIPVADFIAVVKTHLGVAEVARHSTPVEVESQVVYGWLVGVRSFGQVAVSYTHLTLPTKRIV